MDNNISNMNIQKGRKKYCIYNNYRGIRFLKNVYKLYAKLILEDNEVLLSTS
jgi:hypothetical protein